MALSVYFILRGNLKLAYFFKKDKHIKGETINMELAQEVSFLNKAAIKQTFAHLPEYSSLHIDATSTVYIDYDVLQLIKEFVNDGAPERNISVQLVVCRKEYKIENSTSYVTSIISDNEGLISPEVVSNGTRIPSNLLKVTELIKVSA